MLGAIGPGRRVARPTKAASPLSDRRRALVTLAFLLLAAGLIAGRLVLLASRAGPQVKATLAEPLAHSHARPDILDRRGRLLATDAVAHSLYADPSLVVDLDEVLETLSATLPGLDAAGLRASLADRGRRFVWVARGLSPRQAKTVHALGLPGLGLISELKRVYPAGSLAGHSLGTVNIDNRGVAGIERMLDETGAVQPVQTVDGTRSPPLTLTLDLGVEHAVTAELKAAVQSYGAVGASGLVLDAERGEVIAAASLPEVDPARSADWLDPERADRLTGGAFELGSICKTLTIALALEAGTADLDKVYDVRQPLTAAPFTITDLHPQGRPLSVREIFLYSSNVGAGMMALEVGPERQRAFFEHLGLLGALRTEAGTVAPPLTPKPWSRTETITISYGHGLALAPLQFAAAFATLVNGGHRIVPTFLAASTSRAARPSSTLIAPATSAKLREILRLNVTHPAGTGHRAEADGYRVGGKTGTAELPGRGGYRSQAVISSFIGAFPMDAPRYVTLVSLFEPRTGEGGHAGVTAGLTAAPVTARIVARIAPLLDVLPRRIDVAAEFDGAGAAQ